MPADSAASSLRVTLRAARADDVPAMAAIEATAFSDPWPASGFRDLLKQRFVDMTVAVNAQDEPVGYCVLIRAADEAEIANIATAPTARRQGIADRLLGETLARVEADGIRSVFLEVRVSNAAAQGLYAAHGFVPVGRRTGYYERPYEDALVLRRTTQAPLP